MANAPYTMAALFEVVEATVVSEDRALDDEACDEVKAAIELELVVRTKAVVIDPANMPRPAPQLLLVAPVSQPGSRDYLFVYFERDFP